MGHHSCCVVNCKNTDRNSKYKFYAFPTANWKLEQRRKWILAINRKNADGSLWCPKRDNYICSAHFIGGRKSEEQSSPSYVPSIFPSLDEASKVNVLATLNSVAVSGPLKMRCEFCCRNTVRKVGLTFHKFPRNNTMRNAWIKACVSNGCDLDEKFLDSQTKRLCSNHFTSDDFEKDPSLVRKNLKKNAVPTRFSRKPFLHCIACSDAASKHSGVNLYEFPEEASLKKKWVDAFKKNGCGVKNIFPQYALCSNHFSKTCFIQNNQGKKYLKWDAVPHIFSVRVNSNKIVPDIATNEKCAQQVDTEDDFECKQEISDENYTNILDSPSEKNEDIVHSEEFIIKEETSEELVLNDELESLLHEIKKEKSESDDICNKNVNTGENVQKLDNESILNIVHSEEFIIKEETSEKLVLNDELESLLHEIKSEKPESADIICDKIINTGENVQILDNSASFPTENGNIHKKEGQEHNTEQHCDKKISNHGGMNRQKFKHNKKYECKICNETFRKLLRFTKHMISHTKEKPFTCEVCNKSFCRFQHLKSHKLIHSDGKLFTCEICNKSFEHSSALKQHKLLHSGENPFICKLCNQSFSQLENLKQHKLKHTDYKPYTCEVCYQSFRQLGDLERHRITHTGKKPFTCDICNTSFTAKSSLQRHLNIHFT